MSVVRGGGLAAVCCECSESWLGWWQFGECVVRGGWVGGSLVRVQ